MYPLKLFYDREKFEYSKYPKIERHLNSDTLNVVVSNH